MGLLFERTEINGMELRSRIVRSATWTGLADETGGCSQQLIRFYETLARGGAGLLVTGHAYVSREGQAGPRQLGVDSDAAVPMLARLTQAVHRNGGRVVMQLSHAGLYADTALTGLPAKAVTAGKRYSRHQVEELTSEEIEGIVRAFAAGARRARRAGFDGVQLHAAHGYLLNQFLSPAYNVRTDGYGGDLHNRVKPLLEIVRRIRGVLGKGFPLLVKLNCHDFLADGLTESDAVQVAAMLEKEGVDAIEVSGGTRESGAFKSARAGIVSEQDEAYFEPFARLFKERLNIPVILVGGIRRYATAKRLVETGAADYVAMCRPFIKEPGFVCRWRSGDTATVRCVSDNECLGVGLTGSGIGCSR
ncbi:NADH:flavin oxidoreductase [Geomonas azotofigens]|uniref:NADH:flavin oxidoreductase n=1 Tax=Geomonas azotofigens TaxID=2843196 RepID=UPI001C122BCE|nr:NADH:flavin oxidoreductase [Geomonas azotofigens]MBU5613867.1 NADH:flavin oxidoreductase [Geomonas azotofigens]